MNKILTREQFLNKVNEKSFSKYTQLNEAFQNDVNWGDSWIGRLFFSVTRSVKVGYKLTKVEPLLQQLRDQLNILLTESFTANKSNEFNILYIKSVLEEIKDICLSTQTDEGKLKDLIGWDGQTPMWDSENPKSDGRRLDGDKSVIQNIIDRLSSLQNLKKFQGVERDAYIDMLSDFSESLRKLTVDNAGGNTPNLTFSQRVKILMKKYATVQENYKNKLFNYWEFINENTDTQGEEVKINTLKVKASALEKAAEEAEDDQSLKNSDAYKSFIDYFKNLGDEEIKKIKTVKAEDEDGNQEEEDLYVTTKNLLEIETTTQEPNTANPSVNTGNFKEEELKPGKVVIYKNSKGEIKKGIISNNQEAKEGSISLDQMNESFAVEKGKILNVVPYVKKEQKIKFKENGQEIVGKVLNFEGGDTIIVQTDDNKRHNILMRNTDFVIVESYINENTGVPGSPNTNPPNSTPKKQTVKDIWIDYFKEMDEKNPLRLTQREADEFLEMYESGTDTKAIDIGKNPDAIVGIARTFGRAHELYYTPTIPSGMTDRRVSDKTFRKYILLGKESGSRSDSKSPGYGPWAVKSIWNKWTDGVMKIIQDPELKKIFSNANFVVPAKAIKSNESKIFEEVETKQTDGQILFKFMQEMITRDGAANFDEHRKTLMMNYFGVEDKKVPETKPSQKPIADDDKGKNNFFWQSVTGIGDKGKIYGIPVSDSDNNKHEVIFVSIIETVTIDNKKVFFIKATFGYQYMVDRYVEVAENGKYKNFEYPDWTKSLKNKWVNDTEPVYYGAMKIDGNDKISIAYINVKKDENFKEEKALYINKDRFTLKKSQTIKPLGLTKNIFLAELRRNDESGNPKDVKIDTITLFDSEKKFLEEKLTWNSSKTLKDTLKEIVGNNFEKK